MTDLDQKINIEFSEKKTNLFKWQDQTIVVKRFLDIEDKIFLYNEYIKEFFGTEDDPLVRFISAKNELIFNIIKRCTNIEVEKLDGKQSNEFIDNIIMSGLYGEIIRRIENHDRFQKDLYALIKMISEERLSNRQIGKIIDDLYLKIQNFLLDFDDEKIAELMETLKKANDSLEANGVILPSTKIKKEK